jgi:hypothetical protein
MILILSQTLSSNIYIYIYSPNDDPGGLKHTEN